MSKIVRSFTEPTDVYFIGVDFDLDRIPERYLVPLTDDYANLVLKCGEEEVSVESAGNVLMLAAAEFQELREVFVLTQEHFDYGDDLTIYIAKNVLGDITASHITDKGVDVLTEYIQGADFMYMDNELSEEDEANGRWVQDYLFNMPEGTLFSKAYGVEKFLKEFNPELNANITNQEDAE